MNRQNLTLMMLASSSGSPYSPVQIQKAMFLLTTNKPELFDKNSKFSFRPYDYGPFDKTIYDEIKELKTLGFAKIEKTPGKYWNTYFASEKGHEKAEEIKRKMNESDQTYFKEISSFVRNLNFQDLVSSIYEEYPAMAVNSVFSSKRG